VTVVAEIQMGSLNGANPVKWTERKVIGEV